MASSFGLTQFRSKFDQLRISRPSFLKFRSRDKADDEPPGGRVGDADLCLLVENLVIPRLLAEQRSGDLTIPGLGEAEPGALPAPDPARTPIREADIRSFARHAVSDAAPDLLEHAQSFLDAGHSVETLYVELLAPAARRLGAEWETDESDFVDVSMGLWRIQEVLRELSSRLPPTGRTGPSGYSALLTAMPGDQHSLGSLMLGECLHRAGWDTRVLIETEKSELLAQLSGRHFHLAGLTVNCDCHTDALAGLIAAMRAVSRNPAITIMVGGRVINDNPQLVESCGADGTATDAMSAVKTALALVSLRERSFVDAI